MGRGRAGERHNQLNGFTVMKTNQLTTKRTGPKAAWRERVSLPVAEAPVARKRGGRTRLLTDEQRAEHRRQCNASYQKKLRAQKAAKMAALGIVPVPKRRIDLTGRVFGKLTVRCWLETVGPPGRRKARWTVDCACGREISLRSDQMLAKFGRKHCGCDPRMNAVASVPRAGDAPKRGGEGRVPKIGRVKKEPRELSAAELAEEARQAAEKAERQRFRAENMARTRRGEPMLRTPVKEMDAGQWLRLLLSMRRAGARWSEMTQELESAAAFGVTREAVSGQMSAVRG